MSALKATLGASLAAWRSWPQPSVYRDLIVDAHVEKVRLEGEVRNTAALWVIGETAEGNREHLVVWLGSSESAASWRAVREGLGQRGRHGVRYVVAGEYAGLQQALARFLPDAVLQRCQMHFMRNTLDRFRRVRCGRRRRMVCARSIARPRVRRQRPAA